MSLVEFVKKANETYSDLDKLALISSKVSRTLFSQILVEDRIIRVLPKNIETVRDSSMVTLVAYLSCILKEDCISTEDEISRDHIVDCDWQPAASYFQGIARGITGLLKQKPVLEPLSKTPWMQGIWYVQSRALNNLKLDNLAVQIPAQTGIFSYTALRGKGLTMAENISLVNIVNKVIDTLTVTPELIKFCLISPEVLRSRQILKHKHPSSKRMMYWPGEVAFLSRTISPELDALSEPLSVAYNAVTDKISYNNYITAIKSYNKKFSDVTARADRIAAMRYPILFRKGMKGDQETRLGALDIDELSKLCPTDWDGLSKPLLSSKNQLGFVNFLTQITFLEQNVSRDFKTAISEWKAYVMRLPEIEKYFKALPEQDIRPSRGFGYQEPDTT